MAEDLLVNVDVSDLDRAIGFYTTAFDLTVTRHLGANAVELGGWPVKLYLLEKAEGSLAAGQDRRRYARHWTPVHFDVVVADVSAARARALTAGARAEGAIETAAWGKLAVLADPFGNGFCLIQFLGRGYDEFAGNGGRSSG